MAEKNMIALEGEVLSQLQDVLFEMYCDIADASEKHGIHVMLGGGSLLGAVRYQDLIPWDDDLDLMIMRDDVDAFIESIQEQEEKYELQLPCKEEGAVFTFLKVRKKNTLYIESVAKNFPQYQGIFIDVFIVEKCPNSSLSRWFFGMQCNLMSVIASSVIKREFINKDYLARIKQNKLKMVIYMFRSALSYLFFWKTGLQWQYSTYQLFSKYKHLEQFDYVSIPSGRRKFFGECQKFEVFDGVCPLPFRNRIAYGPILTDVYLTNNYGSDYMTPPPEGQRESHGIEALSFDTRKETTEC